MKKIFSMITLTVLMVALAGSCTKNLEERLDKADTDLAGVRTAIGQYEKLQSDITTVVQSLQNEVGSCPASEQKTVWECIAALQSQNNTVSAAISALKALVGEESVSDQIAEALAELTDSYDLDNLEATLQALKAEVADKFDVKLLESKVENLSKTIRNFDYYLAKLLEIEGMLQSVSIIPAYSNGSVKAEEGILEIRCIVTPASILSDISNLKECFTLTVDALSTKAGAGEIPVTTAKVEDKARGIVRITADLSGYLPEDDSRLMLALNAKLGTSDYTTEFVPVYVAGPALPEGALPGEFTVNADDKKVHFSQGNLTYNITDTKWAFYEHQYDCATGYDSNLISLFTWGYDAAKSIVPDGKNYVEGHPTDGEPFSKAEDWGYVFGGESSVWRTLTKDEWVYLFNTRTMTNSKARYSNAVDGVTIGSTTYKGVFLYPDNYNGEVVSSSMTWDAINAAGIVFLPAAGYRNGSSVDEVGKCGYYWSSSAFFSNLAYIVYFDSYDSYSVYPSNFGSRDCGYSVRLITECQ